MGILCSCFLNNDEDLPSSNSNPSHPQNGPPVSLPPKPQTLESRIPISIPDTTRADQATTSITQPDEPNVAVTPESRIEVSIPDTNVVVTPESRIAISIPVTNVVVTPESRIAISIPVTNVVVTPESRIAVSIPDTNVVVTPESRIAVSIPDTNVAVTPKSRIAVSIPDTTRADQVTTSSTRPDEPNVVVTPKSRISVSIPDTNIAVTPEPRIVVSIPDSAQDDQNSQETDQAMTSGTQADEPNVAAIVSEENAVCQRLVQTQDERISSSDESVETCCEEFLTPAFDKDECPTCLEEYDDDNPKIISECFHHFHLSCIYAWMEKSELCPICSKVMGFNEAV